MDVTWEHSKLGKFCFGENDCWVASIPVPAFDVFSYDPGYNVEAPNGTYELEFDAADETETPSADMAKIAAAVSDRQEALAVQVKEALWEDLSGRGPGSGMWWCGAIKDSIEFEDLNPNLSPPTSADDLNKFLRLYQIAVRRGTSRQAPLAELRFYCAFESEHDVGVLTDGKSVIGIGYVLDVEPFVPTKTMGPSRKSSR